MTDRRRRTTRHTRGHDEAASSHLSDESSYLFQLGLDGKAFANERVVDSYEGTYGGSRIEQPALTDREREILRLVVRSFIDTAGPVGSRFLAKNYPLNLSAASIRNTMSDLEELGYLDHPYTSAGRIPTELGYRKFVDELMGNCDLNQSEKQLLRGELDRLMGDTQELIDEGSRLLSRLSNLLGVALSPKLATGVLERLEVVKLSSTRIMFVISVRGGLVKTIIAEVDSDVRREMLDRVVPVLNERLAGLTLEEIRRTAAARIRDIEGDGDGVVRLVMRESATLFSEQSEKRTLRYSGAPNILSLPEFQEPADLRNLIEIMEDQDLVVHLLEDQQPPELDIGEGRAYVTIGSENVEGKANKYSLVTARYRLGDTVGTIGVIGPMRMDYARVMSLVESMARMLSTASGNQD